MAMASFILEFCDMRELRNIARTSQLVVALRLDHHCSTRMESGSLPVCRVMCIGGTCYIYSYSKYTLEWKLGSSSLVTVLIPFLTFLQR